MGNHRGIVDDIHLGLLPARRVVRGNGLLRMLFNVSGGKDGQPYCHPNQQHEIPA